MRESTRRFVGIALLVVGAAMVLAILVIPGTSFAGVVGCVAAGGFIGRGCTILWRK